MNVVSYCSGKIIVDHKVDFSYIESSGGEIGGDKYECLSGSEGGEVVDSLRIFHEGVELSGRKFKFLKGLEYECTLFACFNKDDSFVFGIVFDDLK